METVRFLFAALFMAGGLFILGVATLGLFRLKYVLNRIHASAQCDTLGALMICIAVCIIMGVGFAAIKLLLLVVFIWLTNPVAVHMIGRAEVLTNPRLEDEMEVVRR